MNDLNRQQRKAGKTELYRHFDANGSLLYVGISLSTAQRMGEHRCGSEWWKKVVSITIQRFPTRKPARDDSQLPATPAHAHRGHGGSSLRARP